MAINPSFRSTGVTDKGVHPEMVWVDIETTGLSVMNESILEIGLIVTDKWGRERAHFESKVLTPWTAMNVAKAGPVVQEMHEKSGLFPDIKRLCEIYAGVSLDSPISTAAVIKEARKWLSDTVEAPETGVLPMCGSTINFDRSFLEYHMPELNAWFHYRNVDVTTIKNLCRMHRPDLYKLMEQVPQDEKWHRPIGDLRGSIAEYRFYLNNFLSV